MMLKNNFISLKIVLTSYNLISLILFYINLYSIRVEDFMIFACLTWCLFPKL